ncbi:hypothetical protein RFY10_17240, partial [Acinetobacter baumannii]|nr:hypothetical protein [Acinetobacter baumannii]
NYWKCQRGCEQDFETDGKEWIHFSESWRNQNRRESKVISVIMRKKLLQKRHVCEKLFCSIF